MDKSLEFLSPGPLPLICGGEMECVAVGLGLGTDPEGHGARLHEEAEVGPLQLVLEPEHGGLGRLRGEGDNHVHILREKGSEIDAWIE